MELGVIRTEEKRRSRPPLRLATRRPRILLAEDDVEMRGLIAAALEADGYDVVEAGDGLELLDALEIAASRPRDTRFQLMISDVRMPGLSGLDVLAALRCAEWTTPVIVITAFGDDDTHAEARELGAMRVFDKPFDLDDLRTAVRQVVPLA
ncbi:MAG: response regulator [Candidatus Binatia bacterium]